MTSRVKRFFTFALTILGRSYVTAPTIRTAILFDDPEAAQRTADNGYGSLSPWAYVVPVKTVPA